MVFLGSWTLLHRAWWGRYQIVDTGVYQRYGDAMRGGEVPYRDFTLEYPPGALPAFLAPELTARPRDFGSYGHAYEKWAAGCGIAVVLLCTAALAALRAPPWRAASALALVVVSPLLLGSIVLSRFDLWPAALTVGALAALLSGRDRLGAVVLGAAVAAKLYPGVLVPLGLAWIWRRRGGRAAAAWLSLLAVVLAAIFLPFAVLSPGGLEHSFGTQLGRPLQVESLGAALLVAAHHIGGFPLHPHSDHGSQNLEGTAAAWVGGVSTGLQLALLASVWAAFARGPARPERLVTAAAAAVGAFVAFGKVFSPQFLIWLVPLVPLVGGRVGARAAALLASALVLTQIWFPKRYWQYALGFQPFESSLVLARDVLAAALAVLLLRSLLQDQPLREDRPVREPLQPVGRQVELRSS